jgi:dienelactone hydrolase
MSGTLAVEHLHEGLVFRGQLALPAGPGPHPGVMLMHDGRGVGDFMLERAARLAQLGYAAFAADMHGEGRRFEDPAQGAAAVTALRQDGVRLRERVVANFRAFAALSQVDPDRLGALGYCFGGQCVLELARSGAPVQAVVSFHGTLPTHAPAEPRQVRAQVLALTGARDPYAPADDVAGFQAEMSRAQADWQLTIYGGGLHGFTDPIADAMVGRVPGVGYDARLAKLSWAQAIAFLDDALRR